MIVSSAYLQAEKPTKLENRSEMQEEKCISVR